MADRKRPRGEGDEAGEEALTEQENAALNEVALLQEQLDKISDEGSDRVLAIEQEYIKKKRPVYNARNDVIARIPGFWCTTLSKHPLIHGMLTSDDMAVLNHCTELDVEDCEDIKKGFKITLTFSPNNPYFSNRQLSKSLEYSEDGALSIKGTSPTWSEGYAPPADDEDEAYLGKRSAPHDYRFMMWFMDEELEPGSHDELAEIIRDDIWPNPMKFFQAGEFEAMEEGEGEELYGEGEDEVDEGVEAAGVEEDEYAPGEYDEVYEGAEAGAAGAAEGEGLGTEGVGEGEEEVVIEGEEVVGEDLVEGEEAGGEQP